MTICIKLFIFLSIITGAFAKNDHEVKLFPMNLHLNNPVLSVIAKYVRHNGGLVVYDIKTEFKPYLRIGAVFDEGVLIYPDSDILVRRRVIKMIYPCVIKPIIQINSIYNNGTKEITELLELVKDGDAYREIVRKPLPLDLRPEAANHPIIKMNYTNDNGTISVICDIPVHNRLWFMIGVVKYGNIMIDSDVFTPIYKGITLTSDGNDIKVKVNKMTKNGEHIITICRIIFSDLSNNGICEVIESNRKIVL